MTTPNMSTTNMSTPGMTTPGVSPHLHPVGVNHLALSTRDMKLQLQFWCDVLGLPLKALYWMHGVEGCFHGFVELSPTSYIAFVQHPNNSDDVEIGRRCTDATGNFGHLGLGQITDVGFAEQRARNCEAREKSGGETRG